MSVLLEVFLSCFGQKNLLWSLNSSVKERYSVNAKSIYEFMSVLINICTISVLFKNILGNRINICDYYVRSVS